MFQVRREFKTFDLLVALHYLAKPRLVNRYYAFLQPIDFFPVVVNAYDAVARLRQASRRNKPHVPDSYHANLHLS